MSDILGHKEDYIEISDLSDLIKYCESYYSDRKVHVSVINKWIKSKQHKHYGEPIIEDGKVIAFKRNTDGKIFKIGEWITATDYFCLIGKIETIEEDGFIVFKNIAPNGNDIVRYINNIDHAITPYATAYNTDSGYGSNDGDKTKGSYPYFKQKILEGNL